MTRRNLFRILAGAAVAPFVPMAESKTRTVPRNAFSKESWESLDFRKPGEMKTYSPSLGYDPVKVESIRARMRDQLRQKADADRAQLFRIIDAQNDVAKTFSDVVDHILNAPTPPGWDARIKELMDDWDRKRFGLDKFSEMT